MDYTTQVQMVIDIKPLLMKHVSKIYDNVDTFYENPEYLIRDWNAYEKSNYDPNYRESTSLKGYEIVYHDLDKLPHALIEYRNLTFTIEGKKCALVNFTETQKNEFFRWTGGCTLPSSIDLCEFVDRKSLKTT